MKPPEGWYDDIKTAQDKGVVSSSLLSLELRNAIADKEWLTACANADIAKYGKWQCDWSEGRAEIQRKISLLLIKLKA